MLDQKGQALIAGIGLSPKECYMFTDVKPPVSNHSVHKKNTVKELLMMRRQKWNVEHSPIIKAAKYEVVSPDASPQMQSPPSPVYLNPTANFAPPVIENAFMAMQEIQEPMQQFQEPMQQFQEPMQQFQEPMQQIQEPMQQIQEPMQQIQEPMQQIQEPMHLAALQGQDIPAPEYKMTLFHWQIHKESLKAEGLTVEQLNMQDADGDTFLHIAVAQGKRALAYVLGAKMARCGSLDIKEHNGQTPFQIAVATNQHLIVSDLLSHGAKFNIRDLWGRSPLHVCAEKGYFQSLQSIYRSLARSGLSVDIEMFNYEGLTPLHVAVLSHNAVVREMRSLKNPCSYMMSELAKKRQTYVESIKTLMLMGASYGTKDLKSGRTCLHIASEEANLELLNIFLEQPTSLAFVNVKSFSGNTALHIVSSLQNYKTQVEGAKLLMRKGADPGARNYENELPCQLVPEGPVGEKVRQILKGKYVHF